MAALDWLQSLLGGGQHGDPSTPAMPAQPLPDDALVRLRDMLGQGAASSLTAGGGDVQPGLNMLGRAVVAPALAGGAALEATMTGQPVSAAEMLQAAMMGITPTPTRLPGGVPSATPTTMERLWADESGALKLGGGPIRAFHASPYDFEKFDLGKVGTGQGAQSYGHGIYAAESPAVSGKGGQYDLEFTAKNLGKYDLNPGELQIHRMLRADRSDMDILGELAKGGGYTFDEAMAALDRVKAAKAKIYEVDIHADPQSFLDLDKSLGGQPPPVLQALQEIGTPQSMMSLNADEAIRRAGENPLRAADLFNRGGAPLEMTPADVSARLREAGIPGSRYLDQGSRGAAVDPAGIQRNIEMIEGYLRDPRMHPTHHAGWQKRIEELQAELIKARQPGTSNYAIFDPSIIEILRKYGILPPVAAGGLLATGSEPPT
jgi:hypothetical protein